MSRSGSIIVHLVRPTMDENFYDRIVQKLTSNGWDLDINGEFVFMINGTYDFNSVTIDKVESQYQEVIKSIANGYETSIRMVSGAVEMEFSFISPTEIIFTPLADVLTLKISGITDFSFYLNELCKVFEMVDFNRVQCLFD